MRSTNFFSSTHNLDSKKIILSPDIFIFSPVDSPSDFSLLQSDLNIISSWLSSHFLQLNSSKLYENLDLDIFFQRRQQEYTLRHEHAESFGDAPQKGRSSGDGQDQDTTEEKVRHPGLESRQGIPWFASSRPLGRQTVF